MNNTVTLVGFYGGDETHALSAWTSTKRELTEERVGRMDKLLNMLASEGHHTPFEKSYLHFLVTCDTASHIHLLKHRIGTSINGESARYKEHTEDKFLVPDDWPEEARLKLHKFSSDAYRLYHEVVGDLTPALGRKRAKESARFFLPYSSQLVLDVSFNFRSFMNFQRLRNAEDAQIEIREIADEMLRLVKNLDDFDLSLKAFGYK